MIFLLTASTQFFDIFSPATSLNHQRLPCLDPASNTIARQHYNNVHRWSRVLASLLYCYIRYRYWELTKKLFVLLLFVVIAMIAATVVVHCQLRRISKAFLNRHEKCYVDSDFYFFDNQWCISCMDFTLYRA